MWGLGGGDMKHHWQAATPVFSIFCHFNMIDTIFDVFGEDIDLFGEYIDVVRMNINEYCTDIDVFIAIFDARVSNWGPQFLRGTSA